jgi:alkylated DNA repair dioxygenase AlkB
MDITDISKQETTDKFDGNDNELWVLNSMLAVQNRCYELLRRGDLYSDKFQVDGNPTCEPFTERFENKLGGFTMSLDVLIPNDMTIC